VLEPLEAPELPAAMHEAIHNEVRQHKYSITNPSLKHSQLSVYALLIEKYFRPGRRREKKLTLLRIAHPSCESLAVLPITSRIRRARTRSMLN
jgi:hypothetical protein